MFSVSLPPPPVGILCPSANQNEDLGQLYIILRLKEQFFDLQLDRPTPSWRKLRAVQGQQTGSYTNLQCSCSFSLWSKGGWFLISMCGQFSTSATSQPRSVQVMMLSSCPCRWRVRLIAPPPALLTQYGWNNSKGLHLFVMGAEMNFGKQEPICICNGGKMYCKWRWT